MEELFLPLRLCRHFQLQRVEADETRRVVLVAGFGRVGFHVRHHARTRAELNCSFWLCCQTSLLARRESRSAVSADRVAAEEDQGFA